MKAIDTNILVRSLVRDDPDQTEKANREITSGDILISHSVLLETEWVLRSRYRWPRSDVSRALAGLLTFENIHIENGDLIAEACARHDEGADFADMMHLIEAERADEFVTFDQQLANGPKAGNVAVRLT